MARPVTITTPIPTLEEFGKILGVSKARLRSRTPVFIERRPKGDYAVLRRGSSKATYVFSTQKEAVDRARELRPNASIFVERVRVTDSGNADKWRKA